MTKSRLIAMSLVIKLTTHGLRLKLRVWKTYLTTATKNYLKYLMSINDYFYVFFFGIRN